MKRLYACLFFAVLALCLTTMSHAAMTYLKVQSMASNFIMVQGDTMTWEADCASGATVQCEIWLDVNQNGQVEGDTDQLWQGRMGWTDGDTVNEQGPPDMDCVTNGHLFFSMVLGFAPGRWILRFTDTSDNSTVSNAGEVTAFPAPFRTITGTVSGPAGFNPKNVLVQTERMWMAIADSTGAYALNFDSSFHQGDTIRFGVVDVAGFITPSRNMVILDEQNSISGMNFVYSQPTAWVYGRIRDNRDSLVHISGMEVYARLNDNNNQSMTPDSNGFFRFGFSAANAGQEWEVGVWAEDFAPNYMGTASSRIIIPSNDSVEVNITCLYANAVITGQVTENGGTPSKSYQMTTGDQNASARSISDSATGNYTLHVSSTLSKMWVQIDTNTQWGNGTPLPPDYTVEGSWQKEAYPGNANINFNLVQAGSISGTVRAEGSGNPLKNIQVELRGWDWSNQGSATTNDSGQFTITGVSVGNFRLQAQGSGIYLGEWYNDKQKDSEAESIKISSGQNLGGCNFYLTPGAIVTGRVTDQAMSPLSNMWVEVRDFSWSVNYGGNTNDSGYYSITVPAGVYRAQVNSNNGYLGEWHNNVQDGNQAETLRLASGETADSVDFSLSLAAYIQGTVRNQNSDPLNNVNVMCQNVNSHNWFGGNTDINGEYTMAAEPGKCVVMVSNPPSSYTRQAYNQRSYNSSVWDTITLTVGNTAENIDFALAAGSTISGHIYNAGAMALKNYGIEVRDRNNNPVTQTSTDPSGAFTLTVDPGTYYLQVQSNNGYIGEFYNNVTQFSQAESIVVQAGQNLGGYDFHLDQAAQLNGYVKAQIDGHPLGGAEVKVERIGGSGYSLWTDSTGHYNFQLEPGQYFAWIMNAPAGYFAEEYDNQPLGARLDTIKLIAGENRYIEFSLASSCTLSGTVRKDVDSNPARNVNVRIDQWFGTGWNNSVQNTTTDTLGHYTFTGLSNGNYRLYFSGTGFMAEYFNNKSNDWEANQINLNADTAGIDASLAQGTSLSGTVSRSGDLAPASNVNVKIYRQEGMMWNQVGSTSTSPTGDYMLSGLTTGSYRLFFDGNPQGYLNEYYNDTQMEWEADTIRITAGHDTIGFNATLEQGASLSGTVSRSSDLAPISNVNVQIYRQNGMMWNQVNSTNTSPTGSYTLSGLTTGLYRLFFNGQMQGYVNEYYNDKQMDWQADTIRITAGHDTANFNATLEQGASLSGTVSRSSDLAPISNVIVRISQWTGMWWNQVGSTNTSPTGDYTLTNLATGLYRLYFEGQSQGYINEYYNDKQMDWQADTIRITVGHDTANFNATLEQGSQLSGTVSRSSDLAPISNVNVLIYRQNGMMWNQVNSTNTSPTGSYTLSGLTTGLYRLFFNGQMQGYVNEYYNDTQMDWEADTIRITAGHDTANFNATLEQGASLSGTVSRSSDLAPISNVIVRISQWTGMWWNQVGSTNTSPTGDYTLTNLATGLYRLYFEGQSQGYINEYYNDKQMDWQADTIRITVGHDTANFNATLEQGSQLSGTVSRSSDLAPISNVNVQIYRQNGMMWNQVNSTNTSPTGSYTLSGLTTGLYRLFFNGQMQGYVNEYYNDKQMDWQADTIRITAGHDTANFNATLEQPGWLTGRVVRTSGGMPVQWRQVNLYYTDFTWVSNTQTNSNGDYTFNNVRPGTYFVKATGDMNLTSEYYNDAHDSTAAVAVSVVSGQTRSGIDFSLENLGMIEGYVTSDSSNLTEGLANMTVWLYASDDSSTVWYSTTTDTNGYYLFSNLNDGSYRMYVYDNQSAYAAEYFENSPGFAAAMDITVATGTTARADVGLDVARGSISGTVTRLNQPLENIEMWAYNDQLGIWSNGAVYTDASGFYQIDSLCRGNWRIQAYPNDNTYAGQWYYNDPYYATAQDLSVSLNNTVTDIDFQLTYLSAIRGRVTAEGSGGAPVIGATMWLWDQTRSTWFGATTTDENGDYSFSVGGDFGPDLMPGSYTVMADVGLLGYADEWWDNQTTGNQADQINVAENTEITDINFSLAQGSSLTGTIVRQSDDMALEGIVVNAYDNNGNWVDSRTTDADGQYRFFGLVMNSYYLSVDMQSGYFGQDWNDGSLIVIDHVVVDTSGFDFSLEGAAYVTGNLNRAADNQPQTAWASIRYTNLGDNSVNTFNDYTSAYQLELHAGTYEIQYFSGFFSNSKPEIVVLEQGDAVQLDFMLTPRLVVNEIYSNGGALQNDLSTNPEFVELYAADSANASGCYLQTPWGAWQLPNTCPAMPAGSYVVVHMGSGAIYTMGNVHHVFMNQDNALPDNDGYIGLTDNSSNLLDMVNYGGYSGWQSDWCGWPSSGNYSTDDGAAMVNRRYSVSLLPDGADQNNGGNWVPSDKTPGEANTAATRIVDDITGKGVYNFGGVGVELNITSLTGTDSITVTVNQDSFPTNLVGGNPIKRWFNIHAGSGITSIRTVVTFRYTQAEFDSSSIVDESTLYAARWTGTEWEMYPSEENALNNTVTCTTSLFSDWALGGDGGPVPVELTALTAQVVAGTVQIDWATASEQSNLGWNVYRRNGTEVFAKINAQLIPGGNTTAQPRIYQYADPIVAGMCGTLEYYLEQVDLRGTTHQSPVVTVCLAQSTGIAERLTGSLAALGLSTTPNPFTAAAVIKFTLQQPARGALAVYDMRGSLVQYLAQGHLIAGSHLFVWDGRNQAGQRMDNGVYSVRLTINGVTSTYSVLMAR